MAGAAAGRDARALLLLIQLGVGRMERQGAAPLATGKPLAGAAVEAGGESTLVRFKEEKE
jgi:hypothetical protein